MARKKKRRVLRWVILAAVCIMRTELLACRIAAPETFDQITAPVVRAAESLVRSGKALLAQIPQLLPSPAEETEEPAEADLQLAGDPAIQEELHAEDPKVTEFVQRDGREILTGGNAELVYFNQSEEPWASSKFGRDPIAGYGCGPTSLAMVISSLTDTTVDPAAMAQWASGAGYWAPRSGSYHGIVKGAAEAYGLEAVSWKDLWHGELTADGLCHELSTGAIFVALMTRGHFTNSGHFILLRGITLEGQVLVADPNSRERSLTAWDPQLLIDELSLSRNNGSPLWRLSLPTE